MVHTLFWYNYNTAASSTGKLYKPSFRTNLYGKNSITISAVNSWNKIQIAFGDLILKNLTTTQMKILLTKKCIDKYWQNLSLNINGKTILNIKFLVLLLLLFLLLL